MNILHISRTMGQGGAEKVVYQICNNKASNYKMFVASTGGGRYVDELKAKKIKHYIIPDLDKKNPFLMLKTLFVIYNIIKKEKIDIVHSHHRMAAFYSKLVSIINKKFKRVYTAHNVFYDKKFLLRFSLRGSCIIAVGDGVKNNLVNIYNIYEKNIKIIHNSIEKPKIINKPNDSFITEKKDKIYIGTIGRLSRQKGIDIFLKSMSNIILENPKVYGVIIGDGELKDNLINLSKKLNIEDNIFFLGYRKDVLELISCMDFIVLSSRWEGFPLTPIETFSMKKTIIVSNISGNNEIVKNNENGLLFEKDNVEDLQNKILYLLNNNDIKDIMEKNAFNEFKTKYSYEIFIKKYLDCYNEL